MKDFQFYLQETNSLKDKLGELIDENIKCCVAILRYKGFDTEASCEGHTDHGLPYPWIDFDSYDEKEKLQQYLNEYFANKPHRLFFDPELAFIRLRGNEMSDLKIMQEFCEWLLLK